jgi:hypothetical protein
VLSMSRVWTADTDQRLAVNESARVSPLLGRALTTIAHP